MFQSVSAYENALLAAYSTSPIFVYNFSLLFVYVIWYILLEVWLGKRNVIFVIIILG
jgi:hypothetical protein